jgi:HPt (histidine-containing phosphotransfer) domain-containing protein
MQKAELYNFEYIRSLSDNPDFLSTMIDLFSNTVLLYIEQLQQSIQNQNQLQAVKTIHQLKPTLQAFGCNALIPKTLELEHLLHNNTPINQLEDRLTQLCNDLTHLITVFQKI